MNRRKFIEGSGLLAAGLGVSSFNVFGKNYAVNQNRMFIGTPVLPVYLYEKGIADAFDEMQELCDINTVMTFSHTHVARQYRAGFEPLKDEHGNEITDVFVKTHQKYYANPALMGKNPDAKYADRDLLDEMHEAAVPRNMDIYARILEPYVITGAIPGFEAFAEVNTQGEKGKHVCYNHPEYIRYWHSVIDDLIISHPYLKGFKFGQERGGPMFASLSGNSATCFCEHCQKLARDRKIDVEEARNGMIAFKTFADKVKNENYEPIDGYFVSFMRILAEYPDVLAWEKFWMDSREQQRKRMYKQIKELNPKVQVGWHIDHGMTWDLITRTFWDYSKMGPYSDWLSTAVYFDSMGRRSMQHFDKFYKKILFADADVKYSYPMYLSMLGYDPEIEPPLEAHRAHDTSFSSDYVYRECKRAVEAVGGAAKVYARPGFDMPGYDCNVQPNDTYQAAMKALEAGVDGVWVGREWDELKKENAEAFGRAIKVFLAKK